MAAQGATVASLTAKWRSADRSYKEARRRFLKALDSSTATPSQIAQLRKKMDKEGEIANKAVKRLDAAKAAELERYTKAQNRR